MNRISHIITIAITLATGSAYAATYTYQATTFSWETATTDVVWDQTNTTYPRDDDKQVVNIGFTFVFGGTAYTQVRIITNGELDFGTDENLHQVYANTTLPVANGNQIIAPYWDDLNPGNGGTVRYSMLGTAPNRRFLVSWEGVPIYPSTGSYTFQVILYETGDIKFQYGAGNATGSSATIGVEVDDSDYTQYSYNTNNIVTNGSALLFTATTGAAARDYYAMEEGTWSGAGAVIDSQNNSNGTPVGSVAPQTPATATPPGTCQAANIPSNTATASFDAINSTVDINATIGNTGSISFWYRSATAWNDGNARMLLDASNDLGGADKNFYLVKQTDGRLRFQVEDSADTDTAAVTAAHSFAANTWHYIAITWNMPADRLYLHVDGVLEATSTTNINGTLGNTATLYIGDNRNNGMSGTTNYTGNSANGHIDEVRIYNYARSTGQIITDMNTARACSNLDHIRLLHDGGALTCAPETITVQACSDASCSTLYTGSTTTTLSPTGWVGGNTITFSGGSTTAQLRNTTASTVTLGAASTTPSPSTAARCFNGAAETCSLAFADAGFIFDVPNLTACKTSANVTMTAVKTSDNGTTCAPAFSGNRTINFWSTYSSPATGTQSTNISGTIITTASPGTGVALNFDSNAQTTFTVTYPDAGQMQLNARYTGSGSEAGLILDGNDTFISTPIGLAVYASSSCAAGNASCPVFATAGNTFNLTVKAACWVSDSDTDLSDNPATPNFALSNIPITHTLIAPAGGQTGTLGTSAFNFVTSDAGIHSISQTISEVGVFTFTATPAANSYLGQTVPGGTSPNIGRFKPDHFALSAGALTNRVSMSCSPASTYTYLGENLRLEFTLTAQNSANATTQNYTGSFAKLDPASITSLTIGAIDTLVPTPLTSRISTSSATGTWVNGAAGIFATLALNRTAAADGPYTNAAFGIAPADTDSVTLASYNLDADNSGGNDHGLVAITNIRFGRLRLENVSGSELLTQTLPLYTEYYNSNVPEFTRNSNDSCTTYNSSSLSYSNRQGLSADPTATGSGMLLNGNFDSLNPITLNSASQTGSVDATLAVPAWLQFDWDNNGSHNNDPAAHITFGVYSGSIRQIYIREIY